MWHLGCFHLLRVCLFLINTSVPNLLHMHIYVTEFLKDFWVKHLDYAMNQQTVLLKPCVD